VLDPQSISFSFKGLSLRHNLGEERELLLVICGFQYRLVPCLSSLACLKTVLEAPPHFHALAFVERKIPKWREPPFFNKYPLPTGLPGDWGDLSL